MADPVPIVKTFMSTPLLTAEMRLDGVLAVADAKHLPGAQHRNCFKYVQSNLVPPWLLPNSCFLNPGRGPKPNRTSRLFPSSKVRDGETTIRMKFVILRGGGGVGGREENRPKTLFFSWETP